MAIDLSNLDQAHRLLFEIPLKPVQGQRFQPTGFPGLGAATFQTADGACLLVESAQSMANRLELMVWDDSSKDLIPDLKGLSHVRVNLPNGSFLTDTILESHRLNSPFLLEDPSQSFLKKLQDDLGARKTGPVDRLRLARILLRYDIGSLLHGVFLAKKDLAGGRLRVARAISAFVEATGVQVAASGGVKNDHVNPSWPKKDVEKGFGSVPFSRDEFTAKAILLYVNLDLAQIRGYGLGADVERLLTLLGLYKLRVLLDGGLRLRTACDLEVDKARMPEIVAKSPSDWLLPQINALANDLKSAITVCKELMLSDVAIFTDEIRERKDAEAAEGVAEDDSDAGM